MKSQRKIRRAYFASGTYDSNTGRVTINRKKRIKKSKSKPKLICGHPGGCGNIATHWYQLAFTTVIRCDEHDEFTLWSTVYDSGELHYVVDTKKAKKLDLVPIDITIPAVIGSVHMEFCKICNIAQEDHTLAEQKECAKHQLQNHKAYTKDKRLNESEYTMDKRLN